MLDVKREIEAIENKAMANYIKLLLEALTMCNESRNELTQIQTTPSYWIQEATNAKEKAESSVRVGG